MEVIENFSTGYHSRNGGGDLIITDGNLPIIDVRRIKFREIAAIEHTDSRDKRPVQTVFGAGWSVLPRICGFLAIALLAIRAPLADAEYARHGVVTVEGGRPALIVAGCVVAFIGLIDIGLALAVFAGRNWARILLMLSCVVTTTARFHRQRQRIGSSHLGHEPADGRPQHHGVACPVEQPSAPVRRTRETRPKTHCRAHSRSRLLLDLRSGASQARCGNGPV